MRYRFANWTLDADRFELCRGGESLAVQPKVLSLLLHLLENRHRTVTKEELLQAVWPDTATGESSLTRAVSFARSALGETQRDEGVIRTVRGRGYRIGVSVRVDDLAEERSDDFATDFVCREQELQLARHALHGALTGPGRLLLLVGEPGIGKTRLAAELARIARGRGAEVLWGRCPEGMASPAYWAWVQILRAYLREWGADPIHACLGPSAGELAEIVPEIREQLPELPLPQPGDPVQTRFRLFHAVVTLLMDRSLETPLVLVLDDLHGADEPSLLLFRLLAQALGDARILLVGTYRDTPVSSDHPLAETLAELSRSPHPKRRILLRGLTSSCVGRFIERFSGVEPAPELVEACFSRSEGNPLFLLELLQWLLERGHSPAEATPDWEGEVPEGVRTVIGRRLARLSGECHDRLATASVIGREFSAGVLARVSEVPEGRLLEQLEEAERARVVQVGHLAPGRFRFSHALIAEVLYAELATGARVRLHRRVGDVLERLYTPRPIAPTNLRLAIRGPRLSELAHHFCEAAPDGDAGKAVDYCLQAGHYAMDVAAFEEAGELYGRGLSVLEASLPADEVRRAHLDRALGQARGRAGTSAPSEELD